MRIDKNGHAITSIDEWKQHAPPKSLTQWVEGRSAYELARAWCGHGTPGMPESLKALFDSRAETAGMALDCAYPEHQIRFDTHGGEPRNADLAFVGRVAGSAVAVTVEAKADEPFGATVSKTAADALERLVANPRSKGVQRIADLATALLPPWTKGLPRVGGLPYQLLTAVAGTLAFAIENSAPVAVLVVHEFVTDKTKDELHARNAEAYRTFCCRLNGSPAPEAHDLSWAGPFRLAGKPLFPQVPVLLIGKVVTNRRP